MALAVAALFGATACTGSRFGGCHSNDDCKSDPDADAGPDVHTHAVCFDFRCVECHYDGDCADGKVCNRTLSRCMSLDQAPESSASATSGAIARPPNTF